MINIKEKYFIKQTSINDCGAACLCMIFKMYHINITLSEIKSKLKIDNLGSSLYDMIKLCKKYNIKACGYKKVDICDIKSPCIALMINNNVSHYVVISKVYKNKVLVFDPASNIMYVKMEDFLKMYTGIVLIFESKKTYLEILKCNKKIILKLIIYTLLYTLASISFTYLITNCLNKNHSFIIKFSLSIFLIAIIKEILCYTKNIISFKFQILIDKNITIPILKKIITFPHIYYRDNSVGSSISKINDLSYIKEMLYKAIGVVFINFIFILVCMILFLFKSILLFIIFICYVILNYLLSKKYFVKEGYNYYNYQITNEKFNNRLINGLSCINIIKNLNKEEYFSDSITNYYNDVINKFNGIYFKNQKRNLYLQIINIILSIVLIIYLKLLNYKISDVMFLYSLFNLVIISINEIINLLPLYINYKSVKIRLKDMNNYDDYLNKNCINIKRIEFKNVFYKINNKLILKNINLVINKNEKIFIYGESGIGKTTLFKILLKDISYNKNNIKINNISINKYNYEEIKNSILYVDNNMKLFNGNIKENIFFDDKYDDKCINTVLLNETFKKNNIDINYNIDNLNSNISSGEASKIVMARALNSDKKVIIFDEITSNIDSKTEKMILSNIKNNYKDKTIIFISHRKSNLNLYDKVIKIS